jgi:hypothetical protein
LLKTLLLLSKQGVRRDSNPHLLVHSQVCRNRYTTNTIIWAALTGGGTAAYQFSGRGGSRTRKAHRSTGFQPDPVTHRVALPFPISSPTRIRTRNTSVETRGDRPFHHRAVSGRHGSRTHMTRRSHGLANRPGNPYPATFRIVSGPARSRTGISATPGRRLPLGPWARFVSGPGGSRTHRTDLARVSRPQRHAGPRSQRSVRESNRAPIAHGWPDWSFRLTTAACGHNTYRPSFSVIPGGIEPRAPTRSVGPPGCHPGVFATGPRDRTFVQ